MTMDTKKGNSCAIIFKDQEHEMFYRNCLAKCRGQDVYHKALAYCPGISGDTRRNVERIKNVQNSLYFSENSIILISLIRLVEILMII